MRNHIMNYHANRSRCTHDIDELPAETIVLLSWPEETVWL
jgi:hypothetical protein